MPDTSAPVNIATKRTAVNVAAVAAFVGALSYLYTQITGKIAPELDVNLLLPLAPVIGVIWGIGYRASRALVDKFPKLGWILFGTQKAPVVFVPPASPPPENA